MFSGVVRLCLLCSEQSIAPFYIETLNSPKRSAVDKDVSSENVFRQWRKLFYSPGWRSGYRAGLEIHIGTNRACAKDKPASGPLARRGSNPFPGALFPSLFSEKTINCSFFGVLSKQTEFEKTKFLLVKYASVV